MENRNKTITLYYYVIFGRGDGSDHIPWEYTLTDKQQEAYEKALENDDIWWAGDVPELAGIPNLVFDEILKHEIECLEEDDDYVRECLGKYPMDADELNDLVHSGNKHVLEYLNLGDKTEEELKKWKAEDLDDIPYVCDLDESFEPEFPYTLRVYLPEDDIHDI